MFNLSLWKPRDFSLLLKLHTYEAGLWGGGFEARVQRSEDNTTEIYYRQFSQTPTYFEDISNISIPWAGRSGSPTCCKQWHLTMNAKVVRLSRQAPWSMLSRWPKFRPQFSYVIMKSWSWALEGGFEGWVWRFERLPCWNLQSSIFKPSDLIFF